MRVYASASASGVASASPESPDLSPRVVFLLGSGGVVKPLRPVVPPRPLETEKKIIRQFALSSYVTVSVYERRIYIVNIMDNALDRYLIAISTLWSY